MTEEVDTFAIKLINEQEYLEKHLRNILLEKFGGTEAHTTDIVGIFSDLFTSSVSTLLFNAPPGCEQKVRKDLITFILEWQVPDTNDYH